MPVNIKEVRQLVKLMVDNELTELNVESGTVKVALKRGTSTEPVVMVPSERSVAQASGAAAEEPETKAPAEKLLEIKSPMVGTFYAASSPDGEPFARVGEIQGDIGFTGFEGAQ